MKCKNIIGSIIGVVIALTAVWVGCYAESFYNSLTDWQAFPIFITSAVFFGFGAVVFANNIVKL